MLRTTGTPKGAPYGLVIVAASAVVLGQAAAPVFEPMQPELLGAGLTFTNAFADYDTDGDPDLFVGFDGKPNRSPSRGAWRWWATWTAC